MKKSHEEFYYINKECGNLVRECEIFADAIDNGYDDITDPTSVEYGNYSLYYSLTQYGVI